MTEQLDAPLVELVDETTGASYTPEDVLRKMTDADLKSIADEMKRRCSALLLPMSLWTKGSEFRGFVDDFTKQHGETPKFFTIGDGIEQALPEQWPDSAYWSIANPSIWDNGGYQLPSPENKDEEGNEIKTCRLCGKVM